MSGATLQHVADRLGYSSRQAAWKAITSLLERQERKASVEWRAFHLARLERLLLAVWKDALDQLAQLMGIFSAPNALFFIAVGFILLLLLHFSAAMSRLSDQSKVLAQHQAILEQRVRELEGGGPPAAADAPRREQPERTYAHR